MTLPHSSPPKDREAELGFGSLHFQVTEAAPDTFTGADYLGWIEAELRRLPAATVIEVAALEPAYLGYEWPRPTEIESYVDSGVPYPPLQFCRLKFALEIPEVTQEEALEGVDSLGGAGSEHFVVSIQDGWQMSTAMVWPVGASPGDGSRAVQVVREFLRREVGLGQRSPLEFDCLGPSPAHFTIQLIEGAQGQESAFQFVRREPAPYPNYVFAHSPEFSSLASAVDELHFELNSQLDLIYRIAASRVEQLTAWDRAESQARRILSAYEANGPSAGLRRLVQGRNISRVQIALVELELNQTLADKRINREFESEYVDAPEVEIKQVVLDQLQGFETIHVEPLSKLLEALAAGRQTARAVLIAAVSSLIGAVVAAVATIVAS